MPATEDHKTAVVVVVGHSGVLTCRGSLVILRLDVLPLQAFEVHEAGSVDASTEGTRLRLTEIGALSAEDEILPRGDRLNHDGSVIPTGNTVENIVIPPLTSPEVEVDQVGELGVTVPATVRVHLVVDHEDGVATTARRWELLLLDRLVLVPGLGLQIKAEDVIEGLALIVMTTVATIDVDLALV